MHLSIVVLLFACASLNRSAAAREALLPAEVVESASDAFARLSNLSRTSLFQGNDGRCPPPGGAQPVSLDRLRDGYFEALGSGNYAMLTQWADAAPIDELAKAASHFACRQLDTNLLAACPD